jgi:hypothetical protein
MLRGVGTSTDWGWNARLDSAVGWLPQPPATRCSGEWTASFQQGREEGRSNPGKKGQQRVSEGSS